ncbi:putative disease resistance protein RGA3 isoform X2 [Vigna angularis]|uniref:putative disease resistance protein RGA3 isoform X2 n=1 Tax=Phaseolus angularis TaxID=3914 RepID=UPI0022B377CB|nr:putative disease resistance protein RGA3 isoform X2 [Vigna angularis]
MAEALLGIVLENLGSFLQDQLATYWGVDQHAHKLSSNLTTIRAVLRDAERKQITSHAVKDWLQKLTDAAYVLDDILDECSVQSKTLHSVDGHTSRLSHLHPKDIIFRFRIGKRMKDITQRFHDIHEERLTFELRVGVTEKQAVNDDDDDWRQTSSVITEPIFCGRDKDREKIVKFLLEDASNSEELSIYPIVGMGGLGKTTLAKRVFNDHEISKHFDLRIWICVSDDFNVKRILQSIIECSIGQNPNLGNLEARRKRVEEALQSKRYLLFLDDVWNEDREKWKELKGMLEWAKGAKGATILVTTRLQEVASIMGTHPAYSLTALSEDDSWSLFKHHAFGLNREKREELVAIGKEIVRKCVGSPLAIKTLGSCLRDVSELKQWQNIKESEIWNIREKLQILKLEYCGGLHNFFPENMTQLQDLRHLVINKCPSIAEMPRNIGKLRHLRTLNTFVVGSKLEYGLAELHGLSLVGKLHIRGLENVSNEWEAKEANLMSKKELNRLYLSWGGRANSQGSNVSVERVLEDLEPPSTLKSFGMQGYQGRKLSSWMRSVVVLKDLVEVILVDCKNCEELPPLGKLPHLKKIDVRGMKNVKWIDGESYEEGVEEKAFPSLEKLSVENLPNLERLLRDEGVEMVPRLSQLRIDGVLNFEVPHLPCVEELDARGIKAATSFMEGVAENMTCLKSLRIAFMKDLKVLPDKLSSLSALQKLEILGCEELRSLPNSFQRLTNLSKLSIFNCPWLMERYRRETGNDLQLIAHIPNIELEYILAFEETEALPFSVESWPRSSCSWNCFKATRPPAKIEKFYFDYMDEYE